MHSDVYHQGGSEIRTKVPQVGAQMPNAFAAALKSAKLKDEQVKKHTIAYVDMRKKASLSDINQETKCSSSRP